MISAAFARVLENAKIVNPTARFEIVSDVDRSGIDAAGLGAAEAS